MLTKPINNLVVLLFIRNSFKLNSVVKDIIIITTTILITLNIIIVNNIISIHTSEYDNTIKYYYTNI